MTQKKDNSNQELIDGDHLNKVDQYTNYKKDNDELTDHDLNDKLSEGQEAINFAPDLDENAEDENIFGFDDF